MTWTALSLSKKELDFNYSKQKQKSGYWLTDAPLKLYKYSEPHPLTASAHLQVAMCSGHYFTRLGVKGHNSKVVASCQEHNGVSLFSLYSFFKRNCI